MSFFDWISARSRKVSVDIAGNPAPGAAARSRTDMPREYAPLHSYLDQRYASLVVLSFEQVESLLGFALPAAARADRAWWTSSGGHTSAWATARRSATPNLLARNVAFERLP